MGKYFWESNFIDGSHLSQFLASRNQWSRPHHHPTKTLGDDGVHPMLEKMVGQHPDHPPLVQCGWPMGVETGQTDGTKGKIKIKSYRGAGNIGTINNGLKND